MQKWRGEPLSETRRNGNAALTGLVQSQTRGPITSGKLADDGMADTFHKTFFLEGPAGKLEATLWTSPETDGEFAALVCHPHPLFGGTMHNKVVFRAAKALQQRGMPVLRFNFRGVEKSAGAWRG